MLSWLLRGVLLSEPPEYIRGINLRRLGVSTAILFFTAAFCSMCIYDRHHYPIPMRGYHSSWESGAIGNARTIEEAQAAFHKIHGWYAQSFEELTSPEHDPPLLRGKWKGIKQGYYYLLSSTGKGETYTVHVNPRYRGFRFFYVDQTVAIRYSFGHPADGTSTILGRVKTAG